MSNSPVERDSGEAGEQPQLRPLFDGPMLKALQDSVQIKRQLPFKEVAEQIGIKPEQLAELYGKSRSFFDEKRYLDAIHAFLLLTVLDRRKSEFWLGLGMAMQVAHDFEGAIDAYEVAAACDVENPVAYFYLAKCLFALHDHNSSLEALEMAIACAEGSPQYGELLQQACRAKESLLRREKNSNHED